MKKNVLLITGWGGGTKLLQPLKQQLESADFQVKLLNIFDVLDAEILQKNVEIAKDFDVLIGWSLGGQLATILADEISKQYQQNKVLITLGSNPCFVANATMRAVRSSVKPRAGMKYLRIYQQNHL